MLKIEYAGETLRGARESRMRRDVLNLVLTNPDFAGAFQPSQKLFSRASGHGVLLPFVIGQPPGLLLRSL